MSVGTSGIDTGLTIGAIGAAIGVARLILAFERDPARKHRSIVLAIVSGLLVAPLAAFLALVIGATVGGSVGGLLGKALDIQSAGALVGLALGVAATFVAAVLAGVSLVLLASKFMHLVLTGIRGAFTR